MKKILYILLIISATAQAQTKLSQIPTSTVDTGVSLVGVKRTLGVNTDYRFTIASLKTYINSGVSANTKPLDSVLSAGNTTTRGIILNSTIGTHQPVTKVLTGTIQTQDTTGTILTGISTSTNGAVQQLFFTQGPFTGRIMTQPLSGSVDWYMPAAAISPLTMAAVNVAQTWTGTQGFNSGRFKLNGSTSGSLTINTAATTTSYTITLPSAQGAANTSIKNDGSGGLSWATPVGAFPFTGSTTVAVNHNLGFYPVVQVIDGSGVVIAPNSITHSSVNSFTVTFLTSTTGTILYTK